MKKGKNFFYRINPIEVLAEVIYAPNKEEWFLQFFDDLKKDDPDTAKTELAAAYIIEAHGFREKRSIAGKASAEQRANRELMEATYVEHLLPDVEQEGNERATSKQLAVSSKQLSKEKPKTLSASFDAEHENEPDFYLTKKKRKLTGERLIAFNQFMDIFKDKRGKADAADAWMDIKPLTRAMFDEILAGAERYANNRPKLIESGGTPKMAQGWISGRRWEDEVKSDVRGKTDDAFKAELRAKGLTV